MEKEPVEHSIKQKKDVYSEESKSYRRKNGRVHSKKKELIEYAKWFSYRSELRRRKKKSWG